MRLHHTIRENIVWHTPLRYFDAHDEIEPYVRSGIFRYYNNTRCYEKQYRDIHLHRRIFYTTILNFKHSKCSITTFCFYYSERCDRHKNSIS